MTVIPYMHVGLLVEDLDKAITNFADQLGVTFTEPLAADNDAFEYDGRVQRIQVRYAYSRVGPPYYEIIEAHDRGLYGRVQGMGLHHVGMWETDCERKLDDLTAKGLEVEAVYYGPDKSIRAAYFKPTLSIGTRLEILSELARPGMEALIHGLDGPSAS